MLTHTYLPCPGVDRHIVFGESVGPGLQLDRAHQVDVKQLERSFPQVVWDLEHGLAQFLRE